MKKISIIAVGCFIVLVLGISAVIAAKSSDDPSIFGKYSKKIAETDQLSGNEKILAKVDNDTITKKEFEKQKTLLELGKHYENGVPANVDDREVWKLLIERKVLYQEAKRRGLDISLEEAKDFSQQTAEQYLLNQDKYPPEELAQVESYFSGLGVTPQEYYDRIAPELFQVSLSISNLRNQVLAQKGIDVSDYNKVETAFGEFTDELTKKAKVQYFN